MRPLLIVAFLLQSFLFSYSQDKDSVPGSDTSTKAYQKWKAENQRLQDSLYRLELQRNLEQNGKTLDQFLADMREREEREQRQLYIRIGLGVAFLVVLVIGLSRKRKMDRAA